MENIGEIRVVADSNVQMYQEIHVNGTQNITCIKKEVFSNSTHLFELSIGSVFPVMSLAEA